ncbi:hypothetical protein KKC63_02955 [Patescibacteria group bacterium]|nr:hypothetical protein [Patescibacteria group bacterium]MBU4023232.1 hypothetical protein [Patescibacteria group bacterium]MBU4078424.1 hypothetical protein [Patescibacteria group bacterium]
MANLFQLNKKYGEWAEDIVFRYFRDNQDEIGLCAFYYGSQVSTRKKDITDAPIRPDFIILKTKDIKFLEKKYGLNFNNINLGQLRKLFKLDDETFNFIQENPQFWLTKILDETEFMKNLVSRAHCRLEIKSGFGFFLEKKYEKGQYNIIVGSDFKKRMNKLDRKFGKKLKSYVVYVQLNKVFIATLGKIFGKHGEEIIRLYERRGLSSINKVKTQNLNFLKSYKFADVEGVVKEKKGEYFVKAKPYIEIINGTVRFNLKMPSAFLKNVKIGIVEELKG